MTGLINGGVGILPQGDNTSVKVAPGSRAAGHGHAGKGGGLIPPHGDNTKPKGVACSRSGRTGHNTPRNGVGLPDSDDCALSALSVSYYIDDPADLGDEVSLSIASATKIFWEKSLSSTNFEDKMGPGKIPSNCQFLQPKRTNVETWSVIPPSSRSRDRGNQDTQIIIAASTSLILQAVPGMSQYLVVASKSSGEKIDIMPPLPKMKDALYLAGKANQELNQFRRNMIKPYLPPQFAKLADIRDDSKNFLSGDSIADIVESLQKENQRKCLLRDKTNLKRKQPQNQQEPSNY